MYEKDFVLDEKIEFKIDGKVFSYKPVTAGDELDWVEDYMEVLDGKIKQNFKKKTLCKFRNLLEVPYNKEVINKVIGVSKEWPKLSEKERNDFINKLNPKLFDQIVIHMNKIDSSSNEDKKKV